MRTAWIENRSAGLVHHWRRRLIASTPYLACLAQAFDFEVFLSFGAAIMPFVERRFGFNFAVDGADAELLERIAATDDARVQRGDYPASNMFAVLRHRGGVVRQDFDPISPKQHIALTQAQSAKV
jgi:hypothetical protein